MKTNLTTKTKVVRLAVLAAIGIVVIAGAKYGMDEWEGRTWVNARVQDAGFQHTHYGNRAGVFCGEVSGINGFGMRSPYMRFVATSGSVDIAPLTLDREKVEAFGREWSSQCE